MIMEEQSFRGCILGTTDKLQELRKLCWQYGVPEHVQDGYEEVIDKLLIFIGISDKQRELFWTLADPS